MPNLNSAEIAALMSAIRDVHACRDAVELPRVAVEALMRVIPSDRADFQIYRNAPESFETLYRHAPLQGDDEREALYLDMMTDHPVVAHVLATGDTGPFILSDFIGNRAWQQTRFWAECCREPGDNHLLSNAVSVEPGVQLSMSFSRRLSDFNEHHRMILQLAQDHIAQAWQNARHFVEWRRQLEWMEYGMEVEGRIVVVVGADSRIHVAGPRAMALLQRYFPDWRGSRLPSPLAEWLKNERCKTRMDSDLTLAPVPFQHALAGRSLNARLLPVCERIAAPEVLSLWERDSAQDTVRLQTLGLTPRQAQVLYWMMQGHSNPDIAVLLAVSPRTVDKFTEAIFRRLGVGNRLAASLQARAALNELRCKSP